MRELEVVENKHTGSKFYVIGRNDTFKLSLRVWPTTWGSIPYGHGFIAFRARLDAINTEDAHKIKVLAEFEFPEVEFTGGSSSYASKAAVMAIEFDAGYNVDKFLRHLDNIMFFDELGEVLCEMFPTIMMDMPIEEFSGLLMDQLCSQRPKREKGYTPAPVKFLWGDTDTPSEDSYKPPKPSKH